MTQNEALSALRTLISAYLDKVADLERNRKFAEGLLGMKGGPADDPCHDRFGEEATALLTDYAASAPASADVAAVLRELFSAAESNRDARCAYWMLLAIQGACLPLIERLDREDAAALCGYYKKFYPRYKRLPVQDQVLRQLQQASK